MNFDRWNVAPVESEKSPNENLNKPKVPPKRKQNEEIQAPETSKEYSTQLTEGPTLHLSYLFM